MARSFIGDKDGGKTTVRVRREEFHDQVGKLGNHDNFDKMHIALRVWVVVLHTLDEWKYGLL